MFNRKMFCNRLKTLRLEKKLTLEQLGSTFHVTKQTVSRWETGDRLPSIEIVYMLSEYFNVTADYLLGKSDVMTNYETNKGTAQPNLTKYELELIEDFRTLDMYEQNIIKEKISEMIQIFKNDETQ